VPPLTRKQPQRTCVSCRETGDKRGLTRLVRTADGHVQLDVTGRLPGRGAYLCARPACWQRAIGRGDVLGRALRTTVTAEDREALLTHAPREEAPTLPSPGAGEEPNSSPREDDAATTGTSAIGAVADAGSRPR
jgi:predicted RNA-binding protein YlxR (DUF448 family)